MGYDVSYHPISPQQMMQWYAASLTSDEAARAVCDKAGMHPLYKDKFIAYLPKFRDAHGSGQTFDKTHAYFIAVTQAFFARFHYVRGAQLSMLDTRITPYTAPWSETLPELLGSMSSDNRIVENYSGGVYVPPEKVANLLIEAQTDSAFQAELASVFSDGRLAILIAALQEAKQLGVGLLEATEVIEPNPLDLESTHCLANLFNCDTAGPLLYQQAAQQQLGGLNLADLVAAGKVDRIQVSVDPTTGTVTERPALTRTFSSPSLGAARGPTTGTPKTGGFFSRFRRHQ